MFKQKQLQFSLTTITENTNNS
uniref:Uncharacterized protein n=1 Tax=Rhizophora mucronata TaxID=61149 RepID=A0A2P2JEB7_RHIMU